uniref:Glycosyl transferase family 1 domain-containing protein n=1 Tax=Thermosporothrix sp. COM3 TaxID=2490863 RepID=A0A455SIN5_9CHLR|nr:hypothetical protein KTC_21710 [Thermosporothrix sp. COM3]
MKDIIIIVNARFIPQERNSTYIYGVVQHVLRCADVLKQGGVNVGFLLYKRDEDLAEPLLEPGTVVQTFPAMTLHFHFGMEPNAVKAVFRSAIHHITESWGQGATRDPLLYYQTSALLPYAPTDHLIAITHHSPFVEQVARSIGTEAAWKAFNWDHPKAEHLLRTQNQALEIIASRDNIHCLEISILQQQFLREYGIAERQIHRIPQPVGSDESEPEPLPPLLASALQDRAARSGLVAVTVVSRFDYFKNIELYIDGCCLALQNRALQQVLVIGGFADDEIRTQLQSRIPAELASAFLFIPRMERGVLTGALFPELANQAVFACTSRFDLVPYTALEAARAGLCTIVPDHGRVGAAEYIPDHYQFSDSPAGLATLLTKLASHPGYLEQFQQTAAKIRQATSDEAFFDSFVEICSRI